MEAPKNIPPIRSREELERVPVSEREYGTLVAGKSIMLHEYDTPRVPGDRFYVTEPRGSSLPVFVNAVTEVKDEGVEPDAHRQHFFQIELLYKPLDEA